MKHIALMFILLSGCATRLEDILFAPDLARASPDLGHPDLAQTDLGNPSLCTVANALLCDGFEAAGLQSPPWWMVAWNASIGPDTARAYRGTQSIHVHTDNAVPTHDAFQSELTETAVAPTPDFFVRAYVFVPSPMPLAQMRMIGVLQADGPNLGPSLYAAPNQLQLILANGISSTAPIQLPLDHWVCLELEVVTATAGAMHFWIDGEAVPALDYAGDTTTSPLVGRVSLGAAFFGKTSPQPVFDYWFDEIVFDDKRVGCDR